MRPAPETGPEAVKLWFCPNDDLAPGIAATLAAQWLDEHERESAAQFLFERDRRQYVVSHVLLRRVLALESGIPESEAVIWRSSRGRPFLQKPAGGLPRGGRELDFNLSHAGGQNLLGVVRRNRIGVDVERLDRGDQGFDIIVKTFAPEEREWVDQVGPGRARDVRVLRLWTLKEAYSKARGFGLGMAFDAFAFRLGDDRGVLGFRPPDDDLSRRWRFVELEPVPGVLAAVAVVSDDDETVLELRHGFPWARSAPQRLPIPRAPAGPHQAPGTQRNTPF
ncbi:4'-phosphopantetheinyl transferase family protein [Streptomyces sp. NPDC057137]|uniref:4'-phosphopantetheinyl transferase family protein n=1 Tax=Streptomyces sp. NPDC057137 TaxID=3346030 RepID=UPI0036295F98